MTLQQVDVTRQEQIRRKRAEAEASRQDIEREVASANAALLRAEASDRRDAEKAQSVRMDTMLANKVTIDRRARDTEQQRQEKFLIQEQIKSDQRVYRDRLEAQRNTCGVSDLI